MSEQVKRYDYGYKDDGCGGDRYLGLIEKPDGALVRHSDYAALEAECDKLRAQVSALQSDANSWQSGYDKGREDGAKAADGWKAQHARDSAELRRLCAQRDALAAELAAIKGQQPVAFYWQDIGYPEPRKHGPYFGWPSESALRNVDGGAIPVPLYTLPPATLSPEVQASGPYASVADALAQRYPKPSLLKDCNVSYSNSSRPLAEQGERQETSQDVRALVSADDVRDACANAVSVFAEEANADQCREAVEYMREVLLAQIAKQQAKGKGGKHE